MVARDDAAEGEAPPGPLRPLLRFRSGHLSAPAFDVVERVLDSDEGFRRRVADRASEEVTGRAGWLFLHRAGDWSAELDRLVDSEAERLERIGAEESERSARKRVHRLERTVEDLRTRLHAAESAATRAASDVEAARSGRDAAEAAGRDLRRRLGDLEADHGRALSDLAASRSEAEQRLVQVRRLEAELRDERRRRAAGSAPVLDAVDRAGALLGGFSAALDEASRLLRDVPAVSDPPEKSGGSVAGRRRTPQRRLPVTLRRGALDGTVEATDQLLRTPDVVVLVDGYNVTLQGWEHLDIRTQRERMVGLLGDVAKRTGAEVHVVFDGAHDGGRPAVSSPLAVRVHYSPDEVEADDVIIGMVAEIPARRPVVVVSSDRRVRDGARTEGANLVHSAALRDWDRR